MPVLDNEGNSYPRLMILRGSPAIGKTTISKKIASMNSAKKKAHIPVDNFQLYDFRKPCLSREKFAIRNAAILTKSFLLEEFDVVVDYVFDDLEDEYNFMSFLFGDTIGHLKDVYVQKFYLDAPLEKVIKRNQSRSGKRGEYMSVPLLRKLYAKTDLTKGKAKNEIIVDTSSIGVEKCARYILSYTKAYKNDVDCVDIILPQKDMGRTFVDKGDAQID